MPTMLFDEDRARWVNAAALAAAPAGGTGAIAGGWDTAGNRDTAITAVNSMLTQLRNRGLTTVANAPAGGTGTAAGCYDTAPNRDTCIARINSALAVLRDAGWISTGTLGLSAGAAFDTAKIQWAGAAAIANAPAGGTGAAAGGYDTAGNRDTFIARVNTILTVLRDNGFLALD